MCPTWWPTRRSPAGPTGWLRDLPRTIADLEAEWSVEVGRPYPNATEALVAEARLATGTPVVLKLDSHDGAAVRHEITMLQLAGGRGCASLLRHDAARGALLLEHLGPSLYDLGRPFAERLEILAATAAAVWRPAAGCGLPTGADKARRLIDFIICQWEALGHPCSTGAVEHALACAARRIAAHDDERAVLVHGDVHQLNALRTPGGDTFKLVDPEGLLAEADATLES